MQLVILYGLKGIYIIRHASLEDKPGVDYRENELKKESIPTIISYQTKIHIITK